jgi:hypothetical protein
MAKYVGGDDDDDESKWDVIVDGVSILVPCKDDDEGCDSSSSLLGKLGTYCTYLIVSPGSRTSPHYLR